MSGNYHKHWLVLAVEFLSRSSPSGKLRRGALLHAATDCSARFWEEILHPTIVFLDQVDEAIDRFLLRDVELDRPLFRHRD